MGDRGMFNAAVISRIEELGLQYIAGVKMRQDWDVREIVLEDKMIGNTGYRRYVTIEKDAALAYKGLWQVERAFREIKNTLEIRPIWLSREDRICGHIAVCFLAFCLQVALLRLVRREEKLAAFSFAAMIQELAKIRMVHLKAGEAQYRIRTELSPSANAIYRAAEVPVPRRIAAVH